MSFSHMMRFGNMERLIRLPSTISPRIFFLVKVHAEQFTRYDTLGLQHSLRKLPGYRACRRPGCFSGQIHISTDEGNIWTCEVCKFKICTVHNVEFHYGQTCPDYDGMRRQQTHEDVMSVEWMEANAKRCPGLNCSIPIQKKDGCDHMTCKNYM